MTEDDVRRITLDTFREVLAGAREAFELSGHSLTPARALEAGVAKAMIGANPIIPIRRHQKP